MKLPQFIYPLFEQEALMIYDYLRLFHCLFPSLKNRRVIWFLEKVRLKCSCYVSVQFKSF